MKLYIIGAGPGDPDLITVKGLKLLQQADVVLYADSLVSQELVAKSKPGAEVLKTAGMHLEEMVGTMLERMREGKMVVRVHTGDPAMYGAIMEQMVLLKEKALILKSFRASASVFCCCRSG